MPKRSRRTSRPSRRRSRRRSASRRTFRAEATQQRSAESLKLLEEGKQLLREIVKLEENIDKTEKLIDSVRTMAHDCEIQKIRRDAANLIKKEKQWRAREKDNPFGGNRRREPARPQGPREGDRGGEDKKLERRLLENKEELAEMDREEKELREIESKDLESLEVLWQERVVRSRRQEKEILLERYKTRLTDLERASMEAAKCFGSLKESMEA